MKRAVEKDNYGKKDVPNLLLSSKEFLHGVVVNVGVDLANDRIRLNITSILLKWLKKLE